MSEIRDLAVLKEAFERKIINERLPGDRWKKPGEDIGRENANRRTIGRENTVTEILDVFLLEAGRRHSVEM